MRGFRKTLLSCPLLIAVCASVQAEELCVTCSAPEAVYRCAFQGETAAATGASDPRIQLLCITELAKAGGHQSCSVDRTQSSASCTGPLRTVARPAEDAALPLPLPARPGTQATTEPPEPGAAPAGAPQTVEELARQAAKQSKRDLEKATETVKEGTKSAGKQIEKAGSAVGTAVGKTWDCVVSLFKSC